MSILITVLFVMNSIIIAVAFSLVFFTEMYPAIYRKFRLAKYDTSYTPSIVLFLPCKGADDSFKQNIEATLTLKYPRHRIFYLVEDIHDPAYPIIKKTIAGKKHVKLVITGHAVKCGQKNHNLIKGIEAAGTKDEVFVFMDSDIEITERWLTDLVAPLSNPKVTLATGCMWLSLKYHTLGERIHTFMIALQRALIYFMPIGSVWGGCMAIRRTDFYRLGLKKIWANNISDDMGMMAKLNQEKAKAVLVPTCEGSARDPISSLTGSLNWITRQVLMIKYYLRPLWVFAMILIVYAVSQFFLLPFAIHKSIVSGAPEFEKIAVIILSTVFLLMCALTLMRRKVKDNHPLLVWFILCPVYFLLTAFALLRSPFTSVVHWSNISYYMAFDGSVKKIVRPEPNRGR
ncbi:MAG: glycosyltransferase [Spirochaetes bacterium]|nr:glycosyltransferase [Spirochaetota bacterium]